MLWPPSSAALPLNGPSPTSASGLGINQNKIKRGRICFVLLEISSVWLNYILIYFIFTNCIKRNVFFPKPPQV